MSCWGVLLLAGVVSCGSASEDGLFAARNAETQTQANNDPLQDSRQSEGVRDATDRRSAADESISNGASDDAPANASNGQAAASDDVPGGDLPDDGTSPASEPSAGADSSGGSAAGDNAAPPPDAPPEVPDPDPAAPADEAEPDEPGIDEPDIDDQPPALSQISVDRARYDVDDEELEIRGTVSSSLVELTVFFGDLQQELENDEGSFEARIEDVTETADSITIVASDGAIATAVVDVRD